MMYPHATHMGNVSPHAPDYYHVGPIFTCLAVTGVYIGPGMLILGLIGLALGLTATAAPTWIVQYSGHPETKACPPTPSCLFLVPHGREVGYGCAN